MVLKCCQDLDLSDPEVRARREQEEEAWLKAKQEDVDCAGWLEAKLAKIIVDNIKNSQDKMAKLDEDIEAMQELQVVRAC